MIHLGSVPANSTLYVPFTTYGKTNGESITCSGLAVTDIEIYKNGSTTQRASDNGYTLLDTDGIDFDSITGLHGFSIDLSDNSDASFYAVGSWYWVVVSAITVDSQTVTFLAATFRIAPAESLTGHPKTDVGGWLGTAAATPTVSGVPEVDITHLLGTAWLTPGTAGTPDVNLTTTALGAIWNRLTSSMSVAGSIGKKLADWVVGTIDTYTGNTPQTGDSYARLGAPAGASVSADIAAVPTAAENAAAVEAAILDEGDATALLAAIAAKVEEFLINEGDATATIAAIAAACNAAIAAGTVGTNAATAATQSTAAASTASTINTKLGTPSVSIAADIATRASQTSVDDIPTNAELATALATGVNVTQIDGSNLGTHGIGQFPADVRDWGGLGAAIAIDADNSYPSVAAGHIDANAYADIRAAIGMASADLDTQLDALATATELSLVKDRVSYCLTVLVGACSDAGTSAETYVHAIGGETFTVDYTGLDATGNRTTTTLSKV